MSNAAVTLCQGIHVYEGPHDPAEIRINCEIVDVSFIVSISNVRPLRTVCDIGDAESMDGWIAL